MEIIYSLEALKDIVWWKQSGNKKLMGKITALLQSIEKDPYSGIGKPEPLKHLLTGCWSRRINKEHRLVYRHVGGKKIEIISLRFHYSE